MLHRILAMTAALLPGIVRAEGVDQGFAIENPLGPNENVVDILKKIAGSIQDLVIPVAAAMYLYAGFLWMTSAGKPARLTQAMTVFKYTTIGLVVVFIGAGFVDLIRSILNLGS